MVERQINDFGIEPSGRRKSLHKDRQRKGKNVYNSHIFFLAARIAESEEWEA